MTGWGEAPLVTHPGRPAGALASWLQLWTPSVGLALAPLIIILFPNGRLPSPRWRVVPVLIGIAVVLVALVFPAGAWLYRGPRLLPSAPVPDDPFAHTINALYESGIALVVVSAAIALVGMLIRARRSTGDTRQQIKWFGFGAACAFASNKLALVTGIGWLIQIGIVATFLGIGFGIFRFRLYDVDRLIRRTLIYGLLTIALAVAFAALDVTAAVFTGQDSTIAVALAAFVVALLLRPARDRVQDLVDRLYDQRAYNGVRLLSQLGHRVGREVVDPGRVREALRTALRDPQLDVFYPVRQSAADTVVDGTGDPVDLATAAAGRNAVPVRRDGRDIAVIVHGSVDEPHLAAIVPAAATVLEHARLQAELSVQVAELRASRGRIVAAGDAERRRIERDLHDGAQQRLVGLAVHIQSARRGAAHPRAVDELLTFTVDQLQAGVADIRALVHGILPPALVSGGLPAALAELGDVTVDCDLTGRRPCCSPNTSKRPPRWTCSATAQQDSAISSKTASSRSTTSSTAYAEWPPAAPPWTRPSSPNSSAAQPPPATHWQRSPTENATYSPSWPRGCPTAASAPACTLAYAPSRLTPTPSSRSSTCTPHPTNTDAYAQCSPTSTQPARRDTPGLTVGRPLSIGSTRTPRGRSGQPHQPLSSHSLRRHGDGPHRSMRRARWRSSPLTTCLSGMLGFIFLPGLIGLFLLGLAALLGKTAPVWASIVLMVAPLLIPVPWFAGLGVALAAVTWLILAVGMGGVAFALVNKTADEPVPAGS